MAAPNSPGWYPAPDGTGEQWWNGAGWSDTRRSPDGTTPGLPGYQAAPPAGPPAVVTPAGPAPLGAPDPYAASTTPPLARAVRAGSPSVTGVIFGLVGLVAFAPLGIVGIVLGIMALRKQPVQPGVRGMAIASIVLGATGVLFGLIQLIVGIIGFWAIEFSTVDFNL